MPLDLDEELSKARSALKSKKTIRAKRILDKLLQEYPDNPGVRKALADLAKESGTRDPNPKFLQKISNLLEQEKPEEALELAIQLIRDFPNSPILLNFKGISHALLKEPRLAHDSFVAALEIDKRFVPAMMALGNLHAEHDRFELAIEQFHKAVDIDKNNGPANLNLGRCFMSIGQPFVAENYLETAHSLGGDRPEIIIALAECYRDQDDFEKSNKFFEKALKKQPNHFGVMMSYSQALMSFGYAKRSIPILKRAIKAQPENIHAIRMLGMAGEEGEQGHYLEKLESKLVEPQISDEDATLINFALSEICDKNGLHEEAFEYLLDGNYGRKLRYPYDIKMDKKLFEDLCKIFSNPLDLPDKDFAKLEHTPIFIVGMMRSGTTLTEQIISSHPQVDPRGELEFLNRAVMKNIDPKEKISAKRLEKVREDYIEDALKLSLERPFFTDKMPANFRWTGFILEAFPESKVIHTQRNARAVCWSIFKNLFGASGNGFAYDLDTLVEYYNLYINFMKQINKVYEDRIYNLNYELLVAEPEVEVRKVLKFLNLDWDDSVLKFSKSKRAVKTVSTNQVRQAIYKGSSAQWEKYSEFLNPYFDNLCD